MSSQERGESVALGWQYAQLVPDPGPPPQRPSPEEYERLSEDWLAEQRCSETEVNRPLWIVLTMLALAVGALVLLTVTRLLPALFAVAGALGCLVVAVPVSVALVQARRVTRARIAEEQQRLAERRDEALDQLRGRQEEHARDYARWEARRRAFEAQPHWYLVTAAPHIRRIQVLGGDEVGWSALLTSIGAGRLRAGSDVTVVDLSGRAVAADLLELSTACGVAARRWILPADVPSLDIGTNLGADAFADILATVVAARSHDQEQEPAAALLKQVLDILDDGAGVAAVNAALRVLTEEPTGRATGTDTASVVASTVPHDTRRGPEATDTPDAAGGAPGAGADAHAGPGVAAGGAGDLGELTPRQRAQLRSRIGTDPQTRHRAWLMEQHLSPLDGLALRGADPSGYAQVKVIAVDRTTGEAARRTYGTYTVTALRHLLGELARRTVAGRPWDHTIVVVGADLVPAAEREKLVSAAQSTGSCGVVLAHRTARSLDTRAEPPDAATLPVVMRPPDDTTARVALTMLGAGEGSPTQPWPTSRLTEVISGALSDAVPESYLGAVPSAPRTDKDTASASSAASAPARGQAAGRRRVPPLELTRALATSSVWGRGTRQAQDMDRQTDSDEDPRQHRQPGRPGEPPTDSANATNAGVRVPPLGQLPATAMLLGGDQPPVLADANPGILTLATATLSTLAETDPQRMTPDPETLADIAANLGPPRQRLDWRG
ncbi:hypothetical protein RIF23_16605 [Lipingzhangella sp. LS1_29]|uniref:Type VII secretion protein EccE n=1 Tax=Lipingzhangella rawalii TaxID=2055835 RepID=A0ABU2H9C5_9ACTN|nr:hypothetical protein [Lipingzhangella rawalii]MDS1271915.1 hypothetical protein [Lipingzhangella rawalii]